VTQSADWATDGAHSLKITSNGGWFGLDIPAALDLTGKTNFKFDIKTGVTGTSREVALKFDGGWTWCEGGGWGWLPQNTTTTVESDMLSLSCGMPDFSKLHGIHIWFSGGTFYMDTVRAE
jgi:mannan endo-1,4-beta-mannosidase